jgi:predicted PurR-regulated permease PerM
LLVVPLAPVLLLIFAAVLVATLIRAAAWPFERLGLPGGVAVLGGALLIVLLFVLSGWLFGSQIGGELTQVYAKLPAALMIARGWLTTLPFGEALLSATPDLQGAASRAFSLVFGALGVITNFVLVLISAIYLALQPRVYAHGLTLLFPKDEAARLSEALNASGTALRNYLLGQLLTMAAVGIMVWIGLSIVGVPSAAALGLIIGIANFIPLIGPFIGAVPGLLLAFPQSPELGLGAAVVYLVAQQLEGNVLTPLVQRWAVSIPPALLLFALAALGTLFGPLGLILAAPLAVVIFTLVTLLWTRDALGHDVPVPGEENQRAPSG